MTKRSLISMTKVRTWRILGRLSPKMLAATGMPFEAIRKVSGEEEGAALVETALSIIILMTMLLGITQICTAFYMSTVLDLAAREATRWAATHGANSCTILSTYPYCNYGPKGYGASNTAYTAGTGDPIEIFVRGLGYPGLGNTTVSAVWSAPSLDANGSTQWTTACTTLNDANGNPCNAPGNLVKVTVTYTFPVQLPFISSGNISMTTNSAMMIDE